MLVLALELCRARIEMELFETRIDADPADERGFFSVFKSAMIRQIRGDPRSNRFPLNPARSAAARLQHFDRESEKQSTRMNAKRRISFRVYSR
jgi:hypothetical protein